MEKDMNELAAIIRDSYISEIKLAYEWTGSHIADLTFMKNEERFYLRLSGVRSFYVFEEFEAQYISLCKVLDLDDGIYVSLDPYDESLIVDERDNYCITARSAKLQRQAQQ
jgi:uncharacterized protein YkuJ